MALISRAHLENCTGKTFRERSTSARKRASGERKQPKGGKHPKGCESIRRKRKRTRVEEADACGTRKQSEELSYHLNSLRNGMAVEARSSEEERRVDARALIADEGRDKLRKALGSCK